MQLWKSDNIEAVLCEVEQCAAQCRNRQPRVNDEHVISVFIRLVLRGRVREAVRFVTN